MLYFNYPGSKNAKVLGNGGGGKKTQETQFVCRLERLNYQKHKLEDPRFKPGKNYMQKNTFRKSYLGSFYVKPNQLPKRKFDLRALKFLSVKADIPGSFLYLEMAHKKKTKTLTVRGKPNPVHSHQAAFLCMEWIS